MVPRVLSLYRSILRLSQTQLIYTDKKYFKDVMRKEFRRNKPDHEFEIKVSKCINVYTLSLVHVYWYQNNLKPP